MQEENLTLGLSDHDASYSASALKETFPPSYEPAPNNPPWNLLVAFGTWAASVALLILCSNIAVGIYYAGMEVKPASSADILKDPQAILYALVATIPAHLLTIMICVFVATRGFRYSLRDTLGAKWGGFGIGYCILTVIGFYLLFGALIALLGIEDNELSRILSSSRAAVYVMSFLAVITAPIVEEFVHRGILYSALQRSVGAPLAVFIVSFIFAAIHFAQYQESATAILMISILSLGLTLIRWKSGNILPCIVVHLLFNGVQALGLLLEPYLKEALPKGPETAGLILKIFF